MNARNKRIEEARRLEKRIGMWRRVADLANRVGRLADARSRAYTYEQRAVIKELNKTVDNDEIEARKEYNRQNFKIEL